LASGTVLTVLPFLKVLLGSMCFRVLGAWWKKLEHTAAVGLHRFVDSLLSLFLFFWACFCCCPSIFFVLNSCIIGIVAI
jgi:hypothetical protein